MISCNNESEAFVGQKIEDKRIRVYDECTGIFRDLDTTNYDDDITIGCVLFERSSLEVFRTVFCICGYLLIGENNSRFPIDIHDDHISLLEGTFNCLPEKLQKQLVKYNIDVKPELEWSAFFCSNFILGMSGSFAYEDSFVSLCSNIVEEPETLKRMISKRICLVFPSKYEELCDFAINLKCVLETEILNPQYIENMNYLLDSLLNKYRVNMSREEIEILCYQLCNSVNGKRED